MRLILFLLSVVVLLLVAAVVGPSFVDWNKYKPQIVEQVKNATGLEVEIGGDLSLGVIPSPRIEIEDLVVVAPKKIRFENLLSMKSAEVSVALLPLLQKKIEVSTVKFIEPDIQIEFLPDGTPSWTTDKIAKLQEVSKVAPSEAKQGAKKAASGALESVALNKLEIKDGKLSFINHATKVSHSVEDIDLVVKADSLKGPFEVKGALIHDSKKIALDVETGRLPTGDEGLSVQAEVSLPEASSSVAFSGVAAIKAPYDVQGQTTVKVESLADLAGLFGTSVSVDETFMLDGLLSANEDKVNYNDLKVSLGKFVGNGKFSVQNLKNKNPVSVSGDIKSSSLLDLDPFLNQSASKASKASADENLKNTGKKSARSNSLVPQSLTLPMPLNVNVKLDLAGVKAKEHQVKGVFADIRKEGKTSKLNFKALELPGQGKLDGALTVSYASSSQTPKTGQVTYSDPTVSYQVNGQAGTAGKLFKSICARRRYQRSNKTL